MKKSIAVLSALFLGLSYCPPGAVAMALEDSKTPLEDRSSFEDEALSEEDESLSAEQASPENNENLLTDQALTEQDESLSADEMLSEKDGNLSTDQALDKKNKNSSVDQAASDNEDSLVERLWKKITDTGEKEDLQAGADNEIRQEDESEEHKTADEQASGLKNLQIPQKMGVVIDPWEMDGKGQVYSDVYVIRNTGETSGVLTLSNLTCRSQEQSGVVVKTDKDGLHDSKDKYIYIEMLFGNGDRIIFTPEKSQYQVELKPGEELSICFSGEVNENAFAKWMDQDVAISVVYSWKTEDTVDDLNLASPEDEQASAPDGDGLNGLESRQQANAGGQEPADNQFTDANGEKPADSQQDGLTEKEADQQQTDISVEEPTDRQQIAANVEEPVDTPQAEPIIEDAGDEQKAEPAEGKQESNLLKDKDQETLDIPQTDAEQEDIGREEPDTANDDIQQSSSANINNGSEIEPNIAYNTEEGQIDRNPEIVAEEQQAGERLLSPDEKEKEEIKNIELQEPQKADIKIDSWEVDKAGRIVSQQYLLYNTGDTAGIWTLSDIICKPQEQNGIRITADKKTLQDSEGKAVYMELVLGNGEKAILSQESSTYEMKLEPGEKIAVRFIGEMSGNLFESREEGDIAVTAVCSWNTD